MYRLGMKQLARVDDTQQWAIEMDLPNLTIHFGLHRRFVRIHNPKDDQRLRRRLISAQGAISVYEQGATENLPSLSIWRLEYSMKKTRV